MSITNEDPVKGKTRNERKKYKIVLRRLPRAMTALELEEQLGEIPYSTYFLFCPANPDLGKFSMPRATIVFTEEKHVFDFSNRFNGYVFVDKQGNSSRGLVELAPCSDVPRHKREHVLRDKKINQIQENPEYQKFVAMLEESLTVSHLSLEDQLKELEQKNATRTNGVRETPLTRFIMQRNFEKSKKIEEKRRQRDMDRQAKSASKRSKPVKNEKQNKTMDSEKGRKEGKRLLEFVNSSAKKETKEKAKVFTEEYIKEKQYLQEESSIKSDPFTKKEPRIRSERKKTTKEIPDKKSEKKETSDIPKPTAQVRSNTEKRMAEKQVHRSAKVEREIYRPGRLRKLKEQSSISNDTQNVQKIAE